MLRRNIVHCLRGVPTSLEAVRSSTPGLPRSFQTASNSLHTKNTLRNVPHSLRLRCIRYSSTEAQKHSTRSSSIFSDNAGWDRFLQTGSRTSEPPASSLPSTSRRPRQAMTARESNAFNEMFEMIFDAVAAQESGSSESPTIHDTPVGVGRDGIDDLIGKLRRYPKRLKWTTEITEALDRQKEVVNLFTTDADLLEWADDAVFGESRRYEEAARQAISKATTPGDKAKLPMLQPPTYPHLVALLMRTFREKFNDPHLALSMFEHARHLSIASYVFGCSSEAYHELIETRWKCFQDLKGVHEALEEMNVNGVKVEGRTRQFLEKIRRQVGERHLWVEESELGSSEVWNILSQIERLAAPAVRHSDSKQDTIPKKWDLWKTETLKDEGGDDWGFDQWDRNSQPIKSTSKDGDNWSFNQSDELKLNPKSKGKDSLTQRHTSFGLKA